MIFVRPQSVLQLPSVAWYIDDAISLLSRRTDGVLSQQMLAAAGIDRAAFVFTADYAGAAILSGDFSGSIELLRQAHETSDGIRDFDPPSALAPYRGVEVFLFPYYDDLYISVPDDTTMLLAQSDTLYRELIDRYLDETTLDESLAHLLDTTGPMDFLVARRFDAEGAAQNGQGSDLSHLFAGGGWLDGDDSSSVFSYSQFASTDEAEDAMSEWKNGPWFKATTAARIIRFRKSGWRDQRLSSRESHRTLTWAAGFWATSRGGPGRPASAPGSDGAALSNNRIQKNGDAQPVDPERTDGLRSYHRARRRLP